MRCMPEFAKLGPEAIRKVMDVEEDLGVVLIAYQKPTEFTVLSGSDLEKIQKLEREMGVKLIAID